LEIDVKRILVLGSGRVGSIIASDLAKSPDFEVAVADASAASLDRARARAELETIEADLTPGKIRELAARRDLVVGALPGSMGFAALSAVVDLGLDVVDISFMPENPLDLDARARETGACALVDFGVAPGMSNIFVGVAQNLLDRVDSVSIYVGGLPREGVWPYFYKAPFSPSDVIEEYTRPARLVQEGRVVTRPALSEPELLEFPGVGTLEAFNTDGLRTLLDTVKAPNMVEKTLRYPGHAELMRVLGESGFFGTEPLDVGSVAVRPLDLTSRLLFPLWNYAEGEEDFTVMRVTVEGVRESSRVRMEVDLLDRYDPATCTLSMARTTGFPAGAAARLLAGGAFLGPGVHPPETLGRFPETVDRILEELGMRGVLFRRCEAQVP